MRTMLFVASVALSVSFVAQAAETGSYTHICESSRLRAVERADCRAQMKAASNDQDRRDVFLTFDAKANGSLAR